jgi:hypothetical protein
MKSLLPRLIAFATAALTLFIATPPASAQENRNGAPIAASAAAIASDLTLDQDAAQPVHPAAIEYSHGYEVRARVHKIASIATLPLFAADVAVGQSLFDSSTDGKKTAHAVLGAGIGGLFAVNTVTGVWNMWEARHDPHNRTLRLVHGLLMLSADAGFVATAASAPGERHFFSSDDDRNTHRTIALTSMGIATGGYLIMLFGAGK